MGGSLIADEGEPQRPNLTYDEWGFAPVERREKEGMSYPVGLVLCDRISLDSVFVEKTIKSGAR